MSSKNALDAGGSPRRSVSIALRLTVWYALASFALVVVATGLLYWVLVASMYREDFRDLADNLNNGRMLLRATSPLRAASFPQRRPRWAPRHQPEIWLRVLDAHAHILAETPGMSAHVPLPSPAQLAALTRRDNNGGEIASRSGKRFLVLMARVAGRRPDDPPEYMQLAMDREHDEYLLARYRDHLWIVLAISLFLCALGGYLIARGGMRPIAAIGRTAARIRSTTLHERIAVAGLPAELAGLAESFNDMLDRLERSFRLVSQFSDDAAHELRTPVNNLRGEIEVALGKSRSGADYRATLSSCLEECARISRLIERLLLLARTDNAAEALQRERVDVAKELATAHEFYEAAASDARIDLRLDYTNGLSGWVDRTLFQQAVGNLIANALAHTPPQGRIELAAKADEGGLCISVTDTGAGIAPEHLPRVFDRFYRADRARSGSTHHAGLGLAVVKSIATRHGGRVEIASQIGRGTQVRLILPAEGASGGG